jgi:acetylglutamate kinase
MQKINVIKIGGNIIDLEDSLESFLIDLSKLQSPFILIHGGGKLANQLANQLNIPQKMIDGRRVTDAETLKIATMVYAGFINKNIVAQLQKHQCNALGLSGADANIIKSKKRSTNPIDFGFVGDLNKDDIAVSFLQKLINIQITPIICAITHDGNGQLLNTNADTIANYLAIALSKYFEVNLIYCFEKAGVLKNPNNVNSVINYLDKTLYAKYKAEGIINNGMVTKLDNCFYAIDNGVKKVNIIHASNILSIINNQSNEGTRIR